MIRLLIVTGVALLALVSFGLYNGVYAAKAHERMAQGHVLGKIVLRIP